VVGNGPSARVVDAMVGGRVEPRIEPAQAAETARVAPKLGSVVELDRQQHQHRVQTQQHQWQVEEVIQPALHPPQSKRRHQVQLVARVVHAVQRPRPVERVQQAVLPVVKQVDTQIGQRPSRQARERWKYGKFAQCYEERKPQRIRQQTAALLDDPHRRGAQHQRGSIAFLKTPRQHDHLQQHDGERQTQQGLPMLPERMSANVGKQLGHGSRHRAPYGLKVRLSVRSIALRLRR